MTDIAILKALEHAYKNAEKIDPVVTSWTEGIEQARQFFQGPWTKDVAIQFYYNYMTNTMELAFPFPK